MQCHYAVLGVEMDATDAQIRKAYRKQALLWHPDKNMHRVEEATAQFKLVQAADAVLRDPQERQWYDDHREAILRGGTGMGDDKGDLPDLMGFFSPSCYSGFGDDADGFYAVYDEVFKDIFEWENYVAVGKSYDCPPFGDSKSDYESVVEKFYDFWMSFTSLNTFAHCDRWDVRDAPDRRIKRMMEKENKKLRENKKKEHVSTVRELVNFIRKRDKRLIAKQKLNKEEKAKKAAAIAEREKNKKKAEKKRIRDLENSAEFQEERLKLGQKFAALDVEFNKEYGSDGDNDEEEQQGIFCVACHKGFKSDQQYTNHQKSKKHLAAIKALNDELAKDKQRIESEKSQKSEAVSSTFCVPCRRRFDTEEEYVAHQASAKHLATVQALNEELEKQKEKKFEDQNELFSDEDDEEEDEDEIGMIVESDIELPEGEEVLNEGTMSRISLPSADVEVAEEDIAAAISLVAEAQQIINSDPDAAVFKLTKAIDLHPRTTRPYIFRARANIEARRPKAAIRDTNAVFLLNPDSAQGFKWRGKANALLGNWIDAYKDYSNAQNIDFDEQVETWIASVKTPALKKQEHVRKYKVLHEERDTKNKFIRHRNAKRYYYREKREAEKTADQAEESFNLPADYEETTIHSDEEMLSDDLSDLSFDEDQLAEYFETIQSKTKTKTKTKTKSEGNDGDGNNNEHEHDHVNDNENASDNDNESVNGNDNANANANDNDGEDDIFQRLLQNTGRTGKEKKKQKKRNKANKAKSNYAGLDADSRERGSHPNAESDHDNIITTTSNDNATTTTNNTNNNNTNNNTSDTHDGSSSKDESNEGASKDSAGGDVATPTTTDNTTATDTTENTDDTDAKTEKKVEGTSRAKMRKLKKAMKAGNLVIPTKPDSKDGGMFVCNVCTREFPSRSKMFKHVKDSGHAMQVVPNPNSKTNNNDDDDDEGRGGKKKKKKKK